MKKEWKGFKPCPFCGGNVLDINSEEEFLRHLSESREKSDGRICFSLRCWECSLDIYDHTYEVTDYKERLEILRQKWNRRTA